MKTNYSLIRWMIKLLFVLSLFSLVLVACAPAPQGAPQQPTAGQTPSPQVENNTPTPGGDANLENPAVQAAIKDMAANLNIDPSQIKVLEVIAMEWSDSCLGLGGPAESCLMVITPGYQVMLEAKGQILEYHTNQDGSALRYVISGPGASNGGPLPVDPANLPLPVVNARQALAEQLQVKAEEILVVNIEQVNWPDGCLGIQRPGMMCTQVITPGFRVILEQAGKQYEYRTDEGGGSVARADAPLPKTNEMLLTLEYTEDNTCQRVEVNPVMVKYGTCGGTLSDGLLSPERREQLRFMLSQYAGFAAETSTGMLVTMEGTGQEMASEAEFRSVAEWMKLVGQEASAGRAGAAWGSALAWSRVGGIAGFCDDLVVSLGGWATPSSCKSNQTSDLQDFRLNAEQLEQLYRWIDRYQRFEMTQSDPPGAADAMTVKMIFEGQGKEKATEQVQAEIAAFAAEVYAEAFR